MPVDRSRYPSNWRKVSLTIRRVAGWRCEWCKIENGAPLPGGRAGRVVLTVAHLGTPYADGRPGDKHDKHDIRRENLAALCARCHLRYDLDEHIQHARETRQRKKREQAHAAGQVSLFSEQQGDTMHDPLYEETVATGHEREYIAAICCRLQKNETCAVDQPVERVAGFAGLFPTDRRKKYIGPETSHYDSIFEGAEMAPLLSRARGFYGHCSASVSSFSAIEKK
jgi:hypothetical protein